MQTTANDYQLSPSDLPGMRAWLYFQNMFGSAMPPVNDAVHQFFIEIVSVSDKYALITNPSFQWVISQMFVTLDGITDNREISLVSQYMDFCNRGSITLPCDDQDHDFGPKDGYPLVFTSYWVTFLNGYGYRWGRLDEGGMYYETLFPRGISIPIVNDARRNAINTLVDSWRPTPSKAFIDEQLTPGNGTNKQPAAAARKKLNDWAATNPMLSKVIIAMEANQRTKMKDLIKSNEVYNAEAYFFIFHWLLCFCTGNAGDQKLALDLISSPASSPEYDNDTFINQLIYLSLMHLGNPNGGFRFGNETRQNFLRLLLDLIKTTDDASKIIKASMNTNLDILRSDNAYPMEDMYNPGIDLDTRIAHTVAALEVGRRTIKIV